MPTIPIKPVPWERGYDSFEAAVAGAERHPRQVRALSDSALLFDVTILDGFWSETRAVIRLSNSRALNVVIDATSLDWSVDAPESTSATDQSVPPMDLDWGPVAGVRTFDPTTILRTLVGARVRKLFVNEAGLYVYSQGNPILVFHRATRTDTNRAFLFMVLEHD